MMAVLGPLTSVQTVELIAVRRWRKPYPSGSRGVGMVMTGAVPMLTGERLSPPLP